MQRRLPGGSHASPRPGTCVFAARSHRIQDREPVTNRLAGLFGLSVGVGTLARGWAGPASVLAHLDVWVTAAAGAAGAVLLNNLPAAALLGARPSQHPLALLIGLNLGPTAGTPTTLTAARTRIRCW